MAISIVVPQLGESVVEGTVSKWLKQQGERVRKEEPLVEIQTDKINVEIPSPAEGVLEKIVVPEGTTVLVGTEIAVLSGAGEAVPAGRAAAPAAAAAGAAARLSANVTRSGHGRCSKIRKCRNRRKRTRIVAAAAMTASLTSKVDHSTCSADRLGPCMIYMILSAE